MVNQAKKRKRANVTAAAVSEPQASDVSCRLALACFVRQCLFLHYSAPPCTALLHDPAGMTAEVTQGKGTGLDLQMRMSKSVSSHESLSSSYLQGRGAVQCKEVQSSAKNNTAGQAEHVIGKQGRRELQV